MSTFTKEQLLERAREKVKGLEYALKHPVAFADTLTELEEELELARIALASLEAEPVAWRNKDSGHCGEVHIQGKSPIDCGYEPLYLAPPAPVSVPDGVSGPLAHAYKELTPTFMRNHIDVFERYGIYPDGSVGIQAMRIALDGMSRRAAMLQGAERVSNRDELTGGWVACSERLPEDGNSIVFWHPALCEYCIGEYDTHRKCFKHFELITEDGESEDRWSYVDGVTHWMPLPAKPHQEVL